MYNAQWENNLKSEVSDVNSQFRNLRRTYQLQKKKYFNHKFKDF